jgi:DNA-binding HxlR family transcriptional regulator
MKQEDMTFSQGKKTIRAKSQDTAHDQAKKTNHNQAVQTTGAQPRKTSHDQALPTTGGQPREISHDQVQKVVRDQARERQALQDTIYVIGGKWRLPIINSICNGNKRFREIERSIPGITTRMLSRELKEMELNKLITRTVYAGPPVLVEYESTGYCKSFGPVILAMIEWGIAHRKKILGKEQ